MDHTYLFYTPPPRSEYIQAEEVRLGDTVIDTYGNHIGPIMKVELDWPNNWATFLSTDGCGYQSFIHETIQVIRKTK